MDGETIFLAVAAAFFCWVVWIALQPRCLFRVRISSGAPTSVSGKVTVAFLDQVREVCTRHDIQQGTIRGVVRGQRIALEFSRHFSPPGQQQLRNWWVHSGWSAGLRR